MNNSQVAHVWAQQTKESGKGSNFYFEGPTIYSYGPHFPIARYVKNASGTPAVLVTIAGYSTSTAKHITYVRRALRNDTYTFNVAHLDVTHHTDNKSSYESRIRNALDLVGKARKRQLEHIRVAACIAREANQYAEFFGLEWRLEVPEAGSELIAKYENAEKARKDSERKRATERAEKEHIARSEWRAGTTRGYFDNPTMLRVMGDKVETSRGASVPVEDALRVFQVIKSVKERGQEFNSRFSVGEFHLDHIDSKGNARIGCHHLEWSEIEACAKLLGVQP